MIIILPMLPPSINIQQRKDGCPFCIIQYLQPCSLDSYTKPFKTSLPGDAANHMGFYIPGEVVRTGIYQFEFIISFKLGQIWLGSLWDVINMEFQQQ